MRTLSKIMALAVFALMAAGAMAASLTVTAPTVSTGGVVTVTATEPGLTDGDTVHFSIAPGTAGSFATGGDVTVGAVTTHVASISFTAGTGAGVFPITATDTTGAGAFNGDTGTANIQINNDVLEVDITVTVQAAVDVAFISAPNTRSGNKQNWNLANSSLSANISSIGSIFTDIQNFGGVDVTMTIQQTDPAGFKWTVASPNRDKFDIIAQATTPALSPAAAGVTLVDSSVGAPPPQSYFDATHALQSGSATTGNKLTFNMPTSTSHLDPRAVAGDVITVIYAATAIP